MAPRDLSSDNGEWDPLGLIGGVPTVRRYSFGEDLWEVWICDLPRGNADIDAATAADVLNEELGLFFSWLSGGKYRPRFVAAGAATPTPEETYPCQIQVEQRSDGRANGAFVITDELNTPEAFTYADADPAPAPVTFPDNGRVVRAGAHMVLPDVWNFSSKRAAHELGHALGWPHSYQRDGEGGSQYDNPLDVMSGELVRDGDLKGRPQGTLAINRYAAGWIEPAQVSIHSTDTAEYWLGPVGMDGLQLVILPSIRQGTFTTLDVRVSHGFDAGINKEGVAVHIIDQGQAACSHPAQGGCFGHKRRSRPLVTDRDTAFDYPHVLEPGDSLLVDRYQVRVLERLGDDFRIQVTNSEG